MTGLQTNVTSVSGYLDPLRGFVSSTPNCPANPICSVVARVVQPVDDVVRTSAQLASGAEKLNAGSTEATRSLGGLPLRPLQEGALLQHLLRVLQADAAHCRVRSAGRMPLQSGMLCPLARFGLPLSLPPWGLVLPAWLFSVRALMERVERGSSGMLHICTGGGMEEQ